MDILFTPQCEFCDAPTFKLYDYGAPVKLCLRCCEDLTSPFAVPIVCVSCGNSEIELVSTYEKLRGKRKVLNEFMFCNTCGTEFYVQEQEILYQYRLLLEDKKVIKRGRKKKLPKVESILNSEASTWQYGKSTSSK